MSLQSCEKCEVPLQSVEINTKCVTLKIIACVFCDDKINDMIRLFESGWPIVAQTERNDEYG